jgi:glycerol-3-phosphate dehydrogenase
MLQHERGVVDGFICQDQETGAQHMVRAKCVVNATGVWADAIRRTDRRSKDEEFENRVMPARGSHIVLDASFLPTDQALMVPKTSDGRVLFAIPWKDHLLAGTTDASAPDPVREPRPTEMEVDFILEELGRHLTRIPTKKDVRSSWAGLRPLVRPMKDGVATKSVSREHDVVVSPTGLVTVSGGKWTTYRLIARDVVELCESRGFLKRRGTCTTAYMPLVGSTKTPAAGNLRVYGSEAGRVASLPGAFRSICPELTEGMVRFAARYEYARTVEDVLARRSRLLFLDAQKAASCADATAEILQDELGRDPQRDAFLVLAKQYAGTA